MTRLTLVSEGSGSLAKLQPLHEFFQLRSGTSRGCRMSENKRREVVEFSICVRYIWSKHLTSETNYKYCVSLLASEVKDYSLSGYCYSLKKEGTVGE